jgi:hypothetical protein
MEHIMSIQNNLLAIGVASALTLAGAVSASAGPLPIGNSGLTTAAAPATTEIYWRRGWGPGIGFGLATGALIGAAVASRPYGYYGYGPGYGYYDAPVYAEPYAYAPVYPGYYGGYGYGGYGYGRCTTDEGYGRRRPCNGQ